MCPHFFAGARVLLHKRIFRCQYCCTTHFFFNRSHSTFSFFQLKLHSYQHSHITTISPTHALAFSLFFHSLIAIISTFDFILTNSLFCVSAFLLEWIEYPDFFHSWAPLHYSPKQHSNGMKFFQMMKKIKSTKNQTITFTRPISTECSVRSH